MERGAGPSSPPLATWQVRPALSWGGTSHQQAPRQGRALSQHGPPTTSPPQRNKSSRSTRGPGSRAKGLPSCCHLPGVQPALCTPGPPPPHTGLCGQQRERPLSAEPLAATLSHFPFLCPPPPLHFLTSVPSPLPSWWALPAGRGPSPGDEPQHTSKPHRYAALNLPCARSCDSTNPERQRRDWGLKSK